jgi:hypothetical protein
MKRSQVILIIAGAGVAALAYYLYEEGYFSTSSNGTSGVLGAYGNVQTPGVGNQNQGGSPFTTGASGNGATGTGQASAGTTSAQPNTSPSNSSGSGGNSAGSGGTGGISPSFVAPSSIAPGVTQISSTSYAFSNGNTLRIQTVQTGPTPATSTSVGKSGSQSSFVYSNNVATGGQSTIIEAGATTQKPRTITVN